MSVHIKITERTLQLFIYVLCFYLYMCVCGKKITKKINISFFHFLKQEGKERQARDG